MTDPLTLCPGCFLEPVIDGSCPGCGCDPDAVVSPTVLPPGSILAGYYLLGRLLGKPGAFGLTYLQTHRTVVSSDAGTLPGAT